MIKVFLIVWLLAGCAEVPLCPSAEARIMETVDGDLFIGFSPEAMAQWHEVIRSQARGECVYPKRGGV